MSLHLVTADLAQRGDYTSAGIFKCDVVFDETGQVMSDYWGYPLLRATCIGLERRRGISYPKIVKWLAGPLANSEFENPPLVMDGTSMGAPVFDMFRELRLPNPIVSVTATGGNTMSHAQKSGYCYNVAKRVLVSTARTLIQQERIKLLPELDLGDVAVKECLTYQLKISEDLKETYDAISGQHDDCVTCLLLAGFFLTAPHMRGLRPDLTGAVPELDPDKQAERDKDNEWNYRKTWEAVKAGRLKLDELNAEDRHAYDVIERLEKKKRDRYKACWDDTDDIGDDDEGVREEQDA